jgi:hypothetical protein
VNSERPSILHLLPTHEALLDRHRARLRELMGLATGAGFAPGTMAFIVADLAGSFGRACIEEGAGIEFLVVIEGAAAMAVPIGVDGLLVILLDVVPEAVPPVISRPPATVPVLIVDADDEPALVILEVERLGAQPCS